MRISISEARALGIVSDKKRKNIHYADQAREKSKTDTQVKAWAKLTGNKKNSST